MDFLNGKGSFVQHVYFSQMKMYLIFQLEEIIQKRNSAKASKDFKLADSLRDEAKALGFELEDTKEGTVYKLL